MEAIGAFIPEQAALAAASRSPEVLAGALDAALGLLRAAGTAAVRDPAQCGTKEAADFAGRVEELSRVIGYFQLIAAAAVDRARTQESMARSGSGAGAPAGWLTVTHGSRAVWPLGAKATPCRSGRGEPACQGPEQLHETPVSPDCHGCQQENYQPVRASQEHEQVEASVMRRLGGWPVAWVRRCA
jgi:hypothetical protein